MSTRPPSTASGPQKPSGPQKASGPQTAGPEAPAAPRTRRRGRPSGPPTGETRDRILTVAREEFSARGYDKTSVRSIAKAAEVDSALVHHYFGTKEQIFAAAIEVGFAPAQGIPQALSGAGDDLGERVVRFFLGIWEDPATRDPLLAVVRSALTNDTAAGVFRGLVSRTVLARVADELVDVPDADFRVQLAASQLVGIIMLRYVVKVEPMASADTEELVRQLSPTLQRYLTGPDVHP